MKNERRKFLKNLGLAGTGAFLAPSVLAETTHKQALMTRPFRKTTSLSTIKLALIGAGGMGAADTDTALEHENIELVAVCDLYDGRLDDAKKRWGSNLFLTKDYKEVLKRDDVDAVIIGTPDFWHKKMSVDALNAGKHIYCEKPMVHSVSEGKEIIDAWKKSGKVYIVGSQGMSSLGNEKAKELLAQGVIGELNYAEGFWARNSPMGAWQYPIPEDASTDTVDWDSYLSITKKRNFDPLRFFRWRNYLDYGTGMSGDLFVHLFSSLHFITDSKGPDKIAATGGLRYWKDGREVPDILLGMFDYPQTKEHPAFNLSLRCNFVDGTSGSTFLRLVGSKGSMDVEWDRLTVKLNSGVEDDDPFLAEKGKEASSNKDRKKLVAPLVTEYNAQKGYKGAHYDHFANFFDAIRNNGKVAEDPVFGFRAAAPALLCNESYEKNTFIKWDPEKMVKK